MSWPGLNRRSKTRTKPFVLRRVQALSWVARAGLALVTHWGLLWTASLIAQTPPAPAPPPAPPPAAQQPEKPAPQPQPPVPTVPATTAAPTNAPVHPDLAAALKKAESGDAAAQFKLGLLYASGQWTDRDPTNAVRWFRMAADQGNLAAQFNLAVFLAQGLGTPQNYQEAAV